MLALLWTFSRQEIRHHPWRHAAAVVSVMLGVALALSVHLINASALAEFSQALRSVNGQPDVSLRALQGDMDEAVFARVAQHPGVALANPALEISAYAMPLPGQPPFSTTDAGPRTGTANAQAVRVLGVDVLSVARMAPDLAPRLAAPPDGAAPERLALLLPGRVFLNPAAQALLGNAPFALSSSPRLPLTPTAADAASVRVVGSVAASGGPLIVMDIGAAQDLFERTGQLSRIDLRLQPGSDPAQVFAALGLPPGLTMQAPQDAEQRMNNLSRAYRVNLTVLALVALFTGAFLVFSVLALSVAKRAPQLALLGVLGLSGRQRLQLVLAESLLLGLLGSALGVALGSGLAALALRLLGGDLGGGYFAGAAPSLQWSASAAAVYGALGVLAAAVGGWWPARAAQQLPPAQTLKGLGLAHAGQRSGWPALALLAGGGVLALLPPIGGIAWAAYVSIGLLLLGGVMALPWLIGALYDRLSRYTQHRLLPMLAVERARRVRESAAVAVSGVVAALSLAVALTVMVASFRYSVSAWLDSVLPADVYVRTSQPEANVGGEASYLAPGFADAVAQLPGVARVQAQRNLVLRLAPSRPDVTLLARALEDPLPVPPGHVGITVSEAMLDVQGAEVGQVFAPLQQSLMALYGMDSARAAIKNIASDQSTQTTPSSAVPPFFVTGVWRDYAHPSGSIAIELADFQRISGDLRVNELAVWLQPGALEDQVQADIRILEQPPSSLPPPSADAAALLDAAPLRLSSASQLRSQALRIFDRSFAVTYWLQGVAIVIGLFGVAASFSAQVLARRKEFGLLAHLGFTRRQILAVVAGEGAAWTLIGSAAGLALGLLVAVVLVHVVNPQSFHWTMDLQVPWLRLLAVCAAVVAAGTLTAWLAGRAAAGPDAVRAVKEDW